MAIYSNKQNKKYLNTTNLQKLGITLICIFSALLVNLVFNIVSFVNSFLLGIMGLFTYPMLISIIVFGVMLTAKKKITLAKRDIVYFAIWLTIFVCILQLVTTKELLDNSFSVYLTKTYNYKYSAGGLLAGIITFPVYYLTHYVASIVLFCILQVIFTALIIERLFAKASLKKLTESKVFSSEIKDNMLEATESSEEEQNYQTPKKSVSGVDNSIFISDEDDELQEDISVKKARENDKSKARKILGLDKDSRLEQDEKDDAISSNTLPDNFEKAKQMGISKGSYIKTPYNPFSVSDEKLQKSAPEGKPNIFFHNDDEDIEESLSSSTFETKNIKQSSKQKSNSDAKNLEFIKATMGEYKPMDNDKVDIYDESFTFDDFNTNRKDYLSNSTRFDEAVKQFENTKPFVSEEDDFTIADIETEEVDYNPYKTNLKNLTNNNPYTGEVNNNIVKPQHYLQVGINEIERKQQKQNTPKPVRRTNHRYIKPPIDLLNVYKANTENDDYELQQKGKMLEATLESFKIPAKVSSYTRGPAFTRFELQMPIGIPVSRVLKYVDDISMSLETRGKIRMEIPIPGKNAFGIEVPNKQVSTVGLRDIIESSNFQKSKGMLTYSLGKDISGECRVANLEDAPHCLVAGATKSGKSVCLNSMLLSWIYKISPEDLRLILIDPKQVEFTLYNEIPHLLIPNVITNVEKALCAFTWAIDEMERRFTLFSQLKVKKLEEYNNTTEVLNKINEKLPYIVIVVDELSDLMSQCKKEIEEKIIRLTQKSRAAGIHLVLATQRPSVDVIPGTIKGNLPVRIAFAVSSFADSKTILDCSGAENLLGKGDMLFSSNDSPDPSRIQGAFVSNKEITDVLDFIKENNECDYDSEIEEKMFNRNNNGGFEVEPNAEVFDPLMIDALRNVIKTNNVSTSKLQRIFSIGFTRAGRIVDQMETAGFISPKDSKNNRVVYITQQEFEEKFGEDL